MECRATFSRLRLRLGLILLFQHCAPDVHCSSQAGTNLESFNEPGKLRLQQVLHDARNAEKFG